MNALFLALAAFGIATGFFDPQKGGPLLRSIDFAVASLMIGLYIESWRP